MTVLEHLGIDGEAPALQQFMEAVHASGPVRGLTHGFYRYPARFSPLFARAAIKLFTKPGDAVLDPFMGGGTTVVEACYHARKAVGTDLNALAIFVSKAKTTPLTEGDMSAVRRWCRRLRPKLTLGVPVALPHEWVASGALRNIMSRETWRIRNIIQLALDQLDGLANLRQRRFARCAILKTAQWALDCRRHLPNVSEFRKELLANLEQMLICMERIAPDLRKSGAHPPVCLHRSAAGMETDSRLQDRDPPRLVLTSPPYPGVHILYHRWQVRARRETPAPYWIADSLDGHMASFYTFGDRQRQRLDTYFDELQKTFASVAQLMDNKSVLVQMVGFSEPRWQLQKYLQTMEHAGLAEMFIRPDMPRTRKRLWRAVPNRKWYADQRGTTASSREVVLIHRLR